MSTEPGDLKMGHGGRRPGAGRKPSPLKDVRIGAATAEKILRELGHEQEIVKLYRECGDARLKVQILFRLREWAYGKAGQNTGDSAVRTEVVAMLEHMLAERAGDWRVSIVGSQANDRWEMKFTGLNAFERTPCKANPVSIGRR